MMGLDNPLHIAFLLVIVLLVFGAKRLPEMGRSLGEGLRGFKDSVSGATHAPEIDSGPELMHVESVTADDADAGAAAPRIERTPVGPVA
jgi:sec-independent protein translocase protein TatA